MFRLVLYLVFLLLRAEANVPETENPEICLYYKLNKEENYTVWKDKPLKIIIENANARVVWCKNYYSKFLVEEFVPETEFPNNVVNILNITNVTAEMSTRWVCTVLQEYHGPVRYPHNNQNYTAQDLHFHLHVKGARAVILTANNQSLTYVTPNLSVNYDGEANYTYEDGVDFPMDFSCEKAKDGHGRTNKEDTLRLEYYNAEGILLFQTKPRANKPHMFHSVLKSYNDKYYLDCIRSAREPDREYRYRTTFLKKKVLHDDAVQHALILSVNGQRLSPLSKNDKSYDDYIFKYIDGEVLNVTCQKSDLNLRGSLSFYYNKETVHLVSKVHKNPSGAVISLNISTIGIQNKNLTCSINNTDVEKPNAMLRFLADVPQFGVRIRGLPRHNILYQYTNDNYQWTIEYQYSVNDTLNLTCVSNVGLHGVNLHKYLNPFKWIFERKGLNQSTSEAFDSAAIPIPDTQIKVTDIPFTKILNATYNGTKIKCIYFPTEKIVPTVNITVEVILRLKPELVSETKRDEDTSGQSNDSVPNIVPIGVGVGVATLIITAVCLVLWRKRTKRVNLLEHAYDNLSNQNDNQIPAFPSQWEANYDDSNYAKIDEGVIQENCNYSTENDKLYSVPYKRQSDMSENHYTEIDDYLKPKPGGIAANLNAGQPSNYNKHTATASANYNNFSDSKQGTYDKLKHDNLPINNGYENYNNVKKPNKSKSVTFRPMSNDLRPGRNYGEGNSRQDDRNNERKVKLNNEGYYANTGQDIYTQPGDMQKKPNYENHFVQNEKTNNSDYAEPYDEFEVSCKNDLYG